MRKKEEVAKRKLSEVTYKMMALQHPNGSGGIISSILSVTSNFESLFFYMLNMVVLFYVDEYWVVNGLG